jgi:hypothetical protein
VIDTPIGIPADVEVGYFRKKPAIVFAHRCEETTPIPTPEGVMTANPGDWIITGLKAEIYPCKDDIFRATYDYAGDLPEASA